MAEPARLDRGALLAALGPLPIARAAVLLAGFGVPVLPLYEPGPDGACTCPAGRGCRDAGKHPRIAGGLHAACTDPQVVAGWWRRWPAANLGARTGVAFDVLDLDGNEGVEALRAAVSIGPLEHPGPVARTGGGGWHLLYAPTGLGNRVGLLTGVDWRGRRGMIVLPPSRHRCGPRYRWARPLASELPEVPAGLGRLLAPPPAARTTLPQPPRRPAGAAATGGRRWPGSRSRSPPHSKAAATRR